MNKQRTWLIILLTSVVIMSLLSACAIERNYLIGQWENAENKMIFDFNDTGKLHITSQGSTIEIDYQFVNDKTLVIQGQQKVPFRVNGNQLILTLSEDLTFTKIR